MSVLHIGHARGITAVIVWIGLDVSLNVKSINFSVWGGPVTGKALLLDFRGREPAI